VPPLNDSHDDDGATDTGVETAAAAVGGDVHAGPCFHMGREVYRRGMCQECYTARAAVNPNESMWPRLPPGVLATVSIDSGECRLNTSSMCT
jgi:hypothetical protein